jgi:pimeloyl-ACP methyl ester carboxylesterase
MVTEKYYHTGEIAINVSEWPSPCAGARKMMLIHGYGVSSRTWSSTAPLLAKNYHLFSLDLRGMGFSGRITKQHNRYVWANDVSAIINKIFIKPGYLVGHSLGGWVSAAVASINPNKVSAIVMGDPFTGSKSNIRRKSKPEMKREISSLKSIKTLSDASNYTKLNYPTLETDILHRLARMTYDFDPELLYWANDQNSKNCNYEAMFTKIKCPALLIQANPDKGGIISDEETERVTSLIGKSEKVKWEKSGHSLHVARNHDFAKTVHKFLLRFQM